MDNPSDSLRKTQRRRMRNWRGSPRRRSRSGANSRRALLLENKLRHELTNRMQARDANAKLSRSDLAGQRRQVLAGMRRKEERADEPASASSTPSSAAFASSRGRRWMCDRSARQYVTIVIILYVACSPSRRSAERRADELNIEGLLAPGQSNFAARISGPSAAEKFCGRSCRR